MAKPSQKTTKPVILDILHPKLQAQLTQVNLESFPEELVSIINPYWLLWQPVPNSKEPNKTTKFLKKPVNAAWQKPGATIIFGEANDVYTTRSTKRKDFPQDDPNAPLPMGFGFLYTEEHPFVCIDIDLATDDNHKMMEELDSYTEWSPSNEGLHVIVRVDTIVDKQLLIQQFGSGKRNLSEKRDLFISNGYVTITGRTIPGTPNDIRTIDVALLDSILTKYFKSNKISLPSAHKEAEVSQKQTKELVDNAQKATPTKTKKKRVLKALNQAQVKQLLQQCPVECLESDLFDRLLNNEMAVIDMECTEEAREPWLIIGQAIHNNFKGKLEGYYLWNEWSKTGDKYEEGASQSTWESFSDPALQKQITIGALIKLIKAQHPQFPDISGKGALLGTVANFITYLSFYKFDVYHNEITKELVIDVPRNKLLSWHVEKLAHGQTLSLSEIVEMVSSDLLILGFPGSAFSAMRLKKYFASQGKKKTVNHIRNYFIECGENWDGEDHIASLMHTIKTSIINKQYRPAYRMFIRKWLIQVLAAACHHSKQPVRLNRVLIFSGAQGIGKTRWVESLFPPRLRKYCAADKEIRISNFRSDNVKQTMELSSTLICNINEIDRLFKTASFNDFKAFLDQTVDNIVLPYADAPTELTRRTVFIGSTNQTAFLKDVTGNRRIEIIHCDDLNFKHNVNIDQLWGQVHTLYATGEKWWLNEDNKEEAQIAELRNQINSCSMYIGNESLVEQMEELFDCDAKIKDYTKLTFKDVRTMLGLSDLRTNSQAFNHAKRAVHLWSIQMSNSDPIHGKGKRPKLYYYMPPLREGHIPFGSDAEVDTMEPQQQAEVLQEQMKALQKQLSNLQERHGELSSDSEEVV